MRGVVGTALWTPVLGAGVAACGGTAMSWGWYADQYTMWWVGGWVLGTGAVVAMTAPLASAIAIGLVVWTGAPRWPALAVALIPLLGPVAVWDWTLSALWIPPPREPRSRRYKEETVTAPAGWLTDGAPTPLPWDPDSATTLSDRLPGVRVLWELDPDEMATDEVVRLPMGAAAIKRGGIPA